MNKKEQIENEIEKTLQLFENAERLEPDPHFVTRVEAVIREEENEKFVFSLFLKPAFYIVLFLLNFTSAYFYLTDGNNSIETSTNSELVEVFTNDFNISNSSLNLLNIQ